MNIQTVLFVPGDRPDRFAKALASGAHLVCIDLEDAVAPEQKQAARQAVQRHLASAPHGEWAVRINKLNSKNGLVDLLTLAEAALPLRAIVVPKVESVAEVEIAAEVLDSPEVSLIPLIESTKGLAEAPQIAAARQCIALIFGGHDFASEIGATMTWEPMLAARSMIVHACARAGVLAVDAPFISIGDHSALEEETRRVRALGFSAKAAIHPAQIETIHRVFLPTDSEIEEARDAIRAFREANGAAIRFRGRLLDKPMIGKYERTLAHAARAIQSLPS